MNAALAFVFGVVFAVGLAIAGMTQPAKVIGFLDIGGRWDPSLALVMAGAVGVFLPVYRITRRRSRPIYGIAFASPPQRRIDARLLGGSAIFGVGWGAAGYCPGPAVASLGHGGSGLFVFVAAMILGMLVIRLLTPPDS